MTRACTRPPHPGDAAPRSPIPAGRTPRPDPRTPRPLSGPRSLRPTPGSAAPPDAALPPLPASQRRLRTPGRGLSRSRPPSPQGAGAPPPALLRGARTSVPEAAGGHTHILSGTSRRPSTIMSGRKSSLKAEVMFAARSRSGRGGAGARGRAAAGGADGQGQVRAASPRRRLSRHLSHSFHAALRQSLPTPSARAAGRRAPGAASGGERRACRAAA